MNIKKLLTLLSISLILLLNVTWAMEMSEEEQIAFALEADKEQQAFMADLAISQIGRDEAELAEALWLSEQLALQKNKEQKKLQEASDFELAKKLDVKNACHRSRAQCHRTLPTAHMQNRSAKSVAITKKYKQV